jgi:hypothetical protein
MRKDTRCVCVGTAQVDAMVAAEARQDGYTALWERAWTPLHRGEEAHGGD